MQKPTKPATMETVAAQLERICRYLDSLDRNIALLAGRIQPFDDELRQNAIEANTPQPAKPTSKWVTDTLATIHRRIITIELDTGFIQANLNQISNDAWSRADFRPYLDVRKRGKP